MIQVGYSPYLSLLYSLAHTHTVDASIAHVLSPIPGLHPPTAYFPYLQVSHKADLLLISPSSLTLALYNSSYP